MQGQHEAALGAYLSRAASRAKHGMIFSWRQQQPRAIPLVESRMAGMQPIAAEWGKPRLVPSVLLRVRSEFSSPRGVSPVKTNEAFLRGSVSAIVGGVREARCVSTP